METDRKMKLKNFIEKANKARLKAVAIMQSAAKANGLSAGECAALAENLRKVGHDLDEAMALLE